jgi:hypothetical protein
LRFALISHFIANSHPPTQSQILVAKTTLICTCLID